jgi:hypothetical protein
VVISDSPGVRKCSRGQGSAACDNLTCAIAIKNQLGVVPIEASIAGAGLAVVLLGNLLVLTTRTALPKVT